MQASLLTGVARDDALAEVEFPTPAPSWMEAMRARLSSSRPELTVCRTGEWFERTGLPRVNLHHRPTLVRVLRELAEGLERGDATPTATLLERGWPGERMSEKSGPPRVHVALSTLRKLGLGALLERTEAGYQLRRDQVTLAPNGVLGA